MKKSINIQGLEKLTREQMKSVTGALHLSPPPPPVASGASASNQMLLAQSCAGELCCWNDDIENCSGCVDGADSTWTCSSGSFLAACDCVIDAT